MGSSIEEILQSINNSSIPLSGPEFVKSNDNIQLYTINGEAKEKITRAELMKAIANAIPFILPELGTNAASFVGINDGAMGTTKKADLAKILGVDKKIGFVDMGLPSGTLWASKNVGAETITDSGYYFSWGNVNGEKAEDGQFAEGFGTENGKEPYRTSEGYFVSADLPLKYDAANFYLGGTCHMPSKDDFDELFYREYTVAEWTTLHYTDGLLVTSLINGNTIFFPAAGYGRDKSLLNRFEVGKYWTRSYETADVAHYLYFDKNGKDYEGTKERFYGFTVRPIL